MSTAITLVLLRHGRSRADDEGVHEGRYDSPLTEIGRAQVRARAAAFQAQGLKPDSVITSPLSRARETGQILAEALAAPCETDSDWLEFNNGPLAGVPVAEAERRFPPPAFRNPYEAFWGSGESEWDFAQRASRAVQKLVRRGPGLYLVAAHGGILNAALRHILGAPPPVNGQGVWFAFGDTGYARVIYRPDRHTWLLTEFQPAE